MSSLALLLINLRSCLLFIDWYELGVWMLDYLLRCCSSIYQLFLSAPFFAAADTESFLQRFLEANLPNDDSFITVVCLCRSLLHYVVCGQPSATTMGCMH